MDVSVIMVSYNTCKITENCILSVLGNTKKCNFEIIVIDNASGDNSFETLSKLSRTHTQLKVYKNSKNLGFAVANNRGIKKSTGTYYLLLNSDTEVNSNAIGEMVEWMDKHPRVGIASCALRNADGSLQGTGGHFPTLLRVFSWLVIQDIP